MEPRGSAEITVLLKAWGGGDRAALDRLTPLIHNELHRMARLRMKHERPGNNTFQTTALVNEAYLRLVDARSVEWRDRVHFFAVSATMMRRILVDAARARATGKRGGGLARINLNESIDALEAPGRELVVLDNALEALTQLDPRKARVIELRFFGGLSVEETAEELNLSPQSIMRDWKLAKAWLKREMSDVPND
jgi:RNA polymerase sigma factor (TIGR02999 family)